MVQWQHRANGNARQYRYWVARGGCTCCLKLDIVATYGIASGGVTTPNPLPLNWVSPPPEPCVYSGGPGISLEWLPTGGSNNQMLPSSYVTCSNDNEKPNAFEVYNKYQNWNITMTSFVTVKRPHLVVAHDGRVGINATPTASAWSPGTLFQNTLGGNTYADGNWLSNGNVQVKKKLRINATALVNADWQNNNWPYSFSVDNGNSRFAGDVRMDGKLRIGSQAADAQYSSYKLSVDGDIICRRVVVQTTNWADFVFEPDYKLTSMQDVNAYIQKNRHLPGMPSTAEVTNTGIDAAEMLKLQQQKIEELTLYLIDLQKQIDVLKQQLK
jgi:hypothetical protein